MSAAVALAVGVLRAAEDADWDVPAGSLEWTCWETGEHLADDLFSYAAQLAPAQPPLGTHVPFAWGRERPGAPANAIRADRTAGVAGLLQVLEATGAMLAAIVATRGPEVRAHHVFGVSDPEGFAAMGIVETLVHTYDIAEGLGLTWTPPADLCRRVLHRLFPDVPPGAEPWATLRWATGRGELPGQPVVTGWRWYGTVR